MHTSFHGVSYRVLGCLVSHLSLRASRSHGLWLQSEQLRGLALVESTLCKHCGPPDRCALNAAASCVNAANRSPSSWRETLQPSALLDLITGVNMSHRDTALSSDTISVLIAALIHLGRVIRSVSRGVMNFSTGTKVLLKYPFCMLKAAFISLSFCSCDFYSRIN